MSSTTTIPPASTFLLSDSHIPKEDLQVHHVLQPIVSPMPWLLFSRRDPCCQEMKLVMSRETLLMTDGAVHILFTFLAPSFPGCFNGKDPSVIRKVVWLSNDLCMTCTNANDRSDPWMTTMNHLFYLELSMLNAGLIRINFFTTRQSYDDDDDLEHVDTVLLLLPKFKNVNRVRVRDDFTCDITFHSVHDVVVSEAHLDLLGGTVPWFQLHSLSSHQWHSFVSNFHASLLLKGSGHNRRERSAHLIDAMIRNQCLAKLKILDTTGIESNYLPALEMNTSIKEVKLDVILRNEETLIALINTISQVHGISKLCIKTIVWSGAVDDDLIEHIIAALVASSHPTLKVFKLTINWYPSIESTRRVEQFLLQSLRSNKVLWRVDIHSNRTCSRMEWSSDVTKEIRSILERNRVQYLAQSKKFGASVLRDLVCHRCRSCGRPICGKGCCQCEHYLVWYYRVSVTFQLLRKLPTLVKQQEDEDIGGTRQLQKS